MVDDTDISWSSGGGVKPKLDKGEFARVVSASTDLAIASSWSGEFYPPGASIVFRMLLGAGGVCSDLAGTAGMRLAVIIRGGGAVAGGTSVTVILCVAWLREVLVLVLLADFFANFFNLGFGLGAGLGMVDAATLQVFFFGYKVGEEMD